MMKFDRECCQCGMCCLSEVCAAGLSRYGITDAEKKQRCPGLQFDGDKSACEIALSFPELMKPLGIGAGCCIKARVMLPAGVLAFDQLPDDVKVHLAQRVRDHKMKHV